MGKSSDFSVMSYIYCFPCIHWFSKLIPTCSMLDNYLKKSGPVRSISCARFSCWTIIYVKKARNYKKQ
ncbi:hypothetical protein [Methanobrevibacter sp.]|uniref:hypothetical protein n=1 Tax=Methanobrevibacter sp. TaxID=66852 RepID=UPI00388DC167